MRRFLRQSTVGREPLAIAMSGVRMGERLLQIGMDTPLVTGLLAAKPGLSGESAIAVVDEAAADRARRAVSEASALADIGTYAANALPFERGSLDVIVIHNRSGQSAGVLSTEGSRGLGECRRVLRAGGRLVVLDRGTPSGLAAIFQARSSRGPAETTIKALQAAGFRAVRVLGDRDGYCFVEGLNAG